MLACRLDLVVFVVVRGQSSNMAQQGAASSAPPPSSTFIRSSPDWFEGCPAPVELQDAEVGNCKETPPKTAVPCVNWVSIA
mmetsp:Transcript_13960/g.30381  ORF Transcript_13960/g.30381 Transcript_13960/m.30381 type:complete len:81 (+) Transcript_13960:325-567(+)